MANMDVGSFKDELEDLEDDTFVYAESPDGTKYGIAAVELDDKKNVLITLEVL